MRRLLVGTFLALISIALILFQGYRHFISTNTTEAPVFTDVSHPAGIVNNRVAGIEMTTGQAWGDYNNDGWVDLYVTDPIAKNTLYLNNGDGTFSVSPFSKQVELFNAYSQGASFADYDNDGWKDLIVVTWGADHLFRNENGQGFVDVSRQAGLAGEYNSKTASWGDFNNDGFLDLYIANWACYPKCGRPMDAEPDQLYQNNGDGTFSDVSDYLMGATNGAGFVASFTDIDNDGDADIYLVNDEFVNATGNKLFRNDGAGCNGWCFTQIAKEAGADSRLFGMGLAVGDYNNDGFQDFYYSNVGPMELLQNQGDNTFKEVAETAGVQISNGITWGSVFLDYDNDGWRDLYVAVADTADHKDTGSNQLFHNNADGTFTSVACHNEATDVRMSIGVAYADYNHDGWVDLIVGNLDEGYRLYQNQQSQNSHNHWLSIELEGAGPINRDAVGARVYLTTKNGTQMQEVINGSSVMSGNALELNFGMGEEQSADIRIRWNDGTEQVFKNIQADQRYKLVYPLNGETSLEPLQTNQAAKAKQPSFSAYLQTLKPDLRAYSKDEDVQLAYLMSRASVQPPTSPQAADPALVTLGEALFWDPILSGNRDTACATCHHPNLGTGDNLSVSIGTNGFGLGDERQTGTIREFVPRNATPLYNLGYTEWTTFFWDGRVSHRADNWIETPSSNRIPSGLDSALAAQAMFPVTSRDEMRGYRGEVDIFGNHNELADIVDYRSQPIWDGLMVRVLEIPEYVNLFRAAYPDVPVNELGFQHAANAMAAYEITAFTFEDSPYDRYINGETNALNAEEKQGAILFYGEAGCSSCHSSGLLTDQNFYNIAVPQIGDGKGREQPFDLGRARETGNDCDRYAFRTPPLRNVELTGPWMHNGAFTTLEETVRHHFNPAASLQYYDPSQLSILLAESCQDDPDVLASILRWYTPSNPSDGVKLTDAEMNALMAFLKALTSPSAKDLSHIIPASVPSGLPVGGNIADPNSSASVQSEP
ncbi:MAG: VCBS repeat-containing protein [Anaerolineales bacterium]|nr:VCBS repeat-containing protein [Anaerolineales bacterium]